MSGEMPSDWNSRRKKVYKRDNYECQNCGRKGGPRGPTELHAHHNVPRHSGGTHKMGNLTTFCSECHDAIHYDSHDAPTARVNQVEEKSEREVTEEVIGSPFTYCSKCREKEGVSLHEASESLEYDKMPREFMMRGQRLGSVMCPHSIRCGKCGTLYKKVKPGEDVILEPVEFDNDVSSKWHYGIIGSICSYLIMIGFLSASITQPISMYYDIKYVRRTRAKNPNMRYWVWLSFVPVINILIGILYLKAVRDLKIGSDTSPMLETCPVCENESTELTHVLPPDMIDCTECGARFRGQGFGSINQMTLVDGDSGLTGETHTVEEWERIAESTEDDELQTNLLADSGE